MDDDQPSDDVLLTQSLRAPSEFQRIFERHGAKLHAHLARRVGAAAAEDLSSELWLSAFRSRHRFRSDKGTVIGWLYGIAHNVTLRHYRSVRQRGVRDHALQSLPPGTVVCDIADDVTIRLDAADAVDSVTTAFELLNDSEREILELCIWDELTYIEIAQTLDLPIGTVRSRLSRARQRLASLAALDLYQ